MRLVTEHEGALLPHCFVDLVDWGWLLPCPVSSFDCHRRRQDALVRMAMTDQYVLLNPLTMVPFFDSYETVEPEPVDTLIEVLRRRSLSRFRYLHAVLPESGLRLATYVSGARILEQVLASLLLETRLSNKRRE